MMIEISTKALPLSADWCASRFAQYSVMNGISIIGTTISIFILFLSLRRVLIGQF